MRGDGEDLSFDFETCRAAFELRASDARRRAGRALRRAKRIDDWDQAAALVKLIADNSNRRLAADDEGPTPETIVHHRRRRGDTIETLVANRKLQWHQQAAAMQIATIYESLTAPLWARGGRLEQGRIDGANGSGGIPERHAALYHRKFLPWARWMTDPRSLFQSCEACGRLYTIPRRLNACECGGRLWRASPISAWCCRSRYSEQASSIAPTPTGCTAAGRCGCWRSGWIDTPTSPDRVAGPYAPF